MTIPLCDVNHDQPPAKGGSTSIVWPGLSVIDVSRTATSDEIARRGHRQPMAGAVHADVAQVRAALEDFGQSRIAVAEDQHQVRHRGTRPESS